MLFYFIKRFIGIVILLRLQALLVQNQATAKIKRITHSGEAEYAAWKYTVDDCTSVRPQLHKPVRHSFFYSLNISTMELTLFQLQKLQILK